ncbi:ATPase, T2SS/T4P/T4SS family [Nocardioides sp. GCM10028917]|uniref:ATPase, T2SS/T4P/T4SS family n=1 Tax=Nocardioides sp. GCM10028917 TaxID=3273408 RepID=UPI003617A3B3
MLRFSRPDWVAMQTRQAGLGQTGEIVLRDLVKEALRMRPSRILVGEVRAAECLDLLLALNSGLPGMCTLHANSAREALVKTCTLPLLAGDNFSAASSCRRWRPAWTWCCSRHGPPLGLILVVCRSYLLCE